ncbi:MAG: peptidoglycan-binding protein, partial [Firmicutes bacterium]|nr:peptidoglycan-binding protein [Bacillota bacterium]
LEEAYAILAKIVPMSEKNRKYLKTGEYGINVLAAQGRLKAMGYSVDTTGIMDTATMEALKVIQKNAGGYPYGGLDFFTQKAIVEAFDSWLYADGDAQLAKAIELFQ